MKFKIDSIHQGLEEDFRDFACFLEKENGDFVIQIESLEQFVDFVKIMKSKNKSNIWFGVGINFDEDDEIPHLDILNDYE